MMVGGSAFMFHLTNNIFKSSMPQFQNAAANNPDIINNMMNNIENNGAPWPFNKLDRLDWRN